MKRIVSMLLAISAYATATAATVEPAPISARQLDQADQILQNGAANHPDMFFRNAGLRAYRAGAKVEAVRLLTAAASFADKPSQAMLAAMYWDGDGVAKDRPRAYAWMDLAADRGYHDLLVRREQYWAALDPAEREQALAVGRDIYRDYDDEHGATKLRAYLARARANVTGSHTGFLGIMDVSIVQGSGPAPGGAAIGGAAALGGAKLTGDQYYDKTLWDPTGYAQLKDAMWERNDPLSGKVSVGALQNVSPAAAQEPASH